MMTDGNKTEIILDNKIRGFVHCDQNPFDFPGGRWGSCAAPL